MCALLGQVAQQHYSRALVLFRAVSEVVLVNHFRIFLTRPVGAILTTDYKMAGFLAIQEELHCSLAEMDVHSSVYEFEDALRRDAQT